jgi:hypothetical protein
MHRANKLGRELRMHLRRREIRNLWIERRIAIAHSGWPMANGTVLPENHMARVGSVSRAWDVGHQLGLTSFPAGTRKSSELIFIFMICPCSIPRAPRRLPFCKCLETGDDVEQFLVDSTLAQPMKCPVEVLQ